MRAITHSKKLLAGIFFCFSCTANAQPDSLDSREIASDVHLEQSIGLLVGYNFWREHYAELGISFNRFGRVGHHPFGWSAFASSEVHLSRNLIFGPKIGAWISGGIGGLALGGNLILYTTGSESSLRFRPEIGMGLEGWKLTYGYNFALSNRDLTGINTHVVSLAWAIPILHTKSVFK